MVTLKPGHPRPLARPARRPGKPAGAVEPAGPVRKKGPARPARRPGRRRAKRRRYRSAHFDPRRGRLARLLLPAWGTRPARPAPAAPSPPQPDAAPAPSPPRAAVQTDQVPVREQEAPVREQEAEPRPGRRAEAAGRAGGPLPSEAPPTDVQLLPAADPGEGSSLSSLFGFSETSASLSGGRTSYTEGGEGRRQPGGGIPAAAAGAGLDLPPAAAPSGDPWAQILSLDKVSAGPARERGNTGDTIKRLWDASADIDMGGGLPPYGAPGEELEASMLSKRRFRWPLVISLLVLAGLGAGAVKVLSDLPVREANAREEQYASAAQRLSGAFLPVEQALAAGGWTDDSGLSTLTSRLNTLDGAARAAAVIASEQLPSAPLVGSKAPIEQLAQPKQLLEWTSVQALGVGQQVGNAMAYSISLTAVSNLPSLPAEAPREEVGAIAEQLSLSIAGSRQALASLPEDPLFGAYRQQASEAVTLVENTQADYIAALLEGNPDRAAAASGAMHDAVSGLRSALDAPLGQVQTWALERITKMRAAVTELERITAV